MLRYHVEETKEMEGKESFFVFSTETHGRTHKGVQELGSKVFLGIKEIG